MKISHQWLFAGTCCLAWMSPHALAGGGALPPRPAVFTGKLDPAPDKSEESWPALPKAPAGAPNVVIVLLDDVGFSAPGPFGGVAETPTLERLAREGLSYNDFHVTGLCSPTRAAILTGRNHHAVGFGTVADGASGYPGYNSIWEKDTIALPEILRQNGYSTAAFGKWHNTPNWEITPGGPFEHWPTSLGFEHFYGFLAGADNQYAPRLYRNTTPVEPPATPAQGYHLMADLADEATRWLRVHDAVYPDKPFFLWVAPGGTHWPQHVPAEWIRRYRGQFDQGWDKLRAETFARQRALGVIPASAELTPRPPELPAWDSLPAEERRLLARQAEISAAFLAYTDHHVGRILDEIRALGKSDNTLVLYIAGDNGAAISGGLLGKDAYQVDGKPRSVRERLTRIDQLGGPEYDNLYAAAWGWADNTPFQYGKSIASHLGGARNPLVVSWPAHLQAHGAVRNQFAHVTDILPTVLELTGVPFPDSWQGVAQVPLEGRSLVYSFEHSDAVSPRTQQYFEMSGNRGIYKDGWWAASRLVNGEDPVWGLAPTGQRPWEIYHVADDYSQAHDLAATQPDKLAELAATFDAEARRNDVYPLAPRPGKSRPNPAKGRTLFTYRSGVTRLPSRNGPDVTKRAHRIAADLVVPATGGDGVIIADGGRWGGFSLYVRHRHLVYAANAHGNRSAYIVSRQALPTGAVHVEFRFVPDHPPTAQEQREVSPFAPQPAVPGTGSLYVNDQSVGQGHVQKIIYSPYESLDIGMDLGTPVSQDYPVPNAYTGTIRKVEVELQ